ncbi:MAG: prolipoprotein diacylglyceryl transferase, partial [Candidatus Omnitrophica bacterium]|nr:prolipoprotein diacylglyceryl transferase [Candidatus Omnitrophota bacterium]
MHPILLKLGPITITSYGALLALAFLSAVGLARHVTRRSLTTSVPLQDAALVDWAGWSVAGGLLGGRFLYILLNWELYARQPLEMLAVWHGGLVWYGGFLGGLLATGWYLKAHGYGVLRGLDQVIPFVALGHAVGRVGCFLNGCCSGKPTWAWCGVWMPGSAQPVMPTQVLES